MALRISAKYTLEALRCCALSGSNCGRRSKIPAIPSTDLGFNTRPSSARHSSSSYGTYTSRAAPPCKSEASSRSNLYRLSGIIRGYKVCNSSVGHALSISTKQDCIAFFLSETSLQPCSTISLPFSPRRCSLAPTKLKRPSLSLPSKKVSAALATNIVTTARRRAPALSAAIGHSVVAASCNVRTGDDVRPATALRQRSLSSKVVVVAALECVVS
mmetsp:Transcript_3650/g.13101  ORF Transcript_3650/g.13101 Transcript_3650/m.13101 type:complete len:215 (+) Transcript_3650:1962-2606(+)